MSGNSTSQCSYPLSQVVSNACRRDVKRELSSAAVETTQLVRRFLDVKCCELQPAVGMQHVEAALVSSPWPGRTPHIGAAFRALCVHTRT